jgi:glycosyltransferase involved in cell wall biosynthesis
MDPKKPSIGIIIPNDFVKRLPFAGGSGFILNLIPSIDNRLTIFGSGANGTALWKKYQINKNVTFIATYPVTFPSPFPGRLKALIGYLKNRRRILQSDIDVLYVHSPECALPFLFGKNRKPLVFHQHGSGNPVVTAKFTWARNRLIIWLFDRIHQEIYRRADWIIAIDRVCVQQAISYGAQNKISLLMNAVDTNRFRPDNVVIRSTERTSLQISEDAFVVLFVGRLEEIKQVDILVESMVSLKDKFPVRLLLAGDGTKYEPLKKLVNRLHLSSAVKFLGKVSHDDIHLYYNIADVLVLPSKMEGVPMVILEALACGTPVVASAVGGIPDLVRTGENGMLLETVTHETIGDGITAVRQMNCQRYAVSSTVSKWSAVSVAEELSSIFQKLLMNKGIDLT